MFVVDVYVERFSPKETEWKSEKKEKTDKFSFDGFPFFFSFFNLPNHFLVPRKNDGKVCFSYQKKNFIESENKIG